MTTFEEERPVHVAPNESDPGRALFLHVHRSLEQPIRIPDIKDSDDFLKRCPQNATIDLEDRSSGKSLRELLAKAGPAAKDLLGCSGTGELASAEELEEDHLEIDSCDWIKDPRRLAWYSMLLAQLEARERVLRHLLNDRFSINVGGRMSDDEKRALAAVAREEAEKLRDEHHLELQQRHRTGRASRQKLVDETRERAQRYMNTNEKNSFDPTEDDFTKVWG